MVWLKTSYNAGTTLVSRVLYISLDLVLCLLLCFCLDLEPLFSLNVWYVACTSIHQLSPPKYYFQLVFLNPSWASYPHVRTPNFRVARSSSYMVSVFLKKTEWTWETVYLKYIHSYYWLLFVKHFLRCTYSCG